MSYDDADIWSCVNKCVSILFLTTNLKVKSIEGEWSIIRSTGHDISTCDTSSPRWLTASLIAARSIRAGKPLTTHNNGSSYNRL